MYEEKCGQLEDCFKDYPGTKRVKEPELSYEFKKQQQKLGLLTEGVNILAEKLKPILSNETPENCADKAPEPVTLVAKEIRKNTDVIEQNVNYIQDLINRLEI